MSVTNIVITGGPCAGKSTGLSRIEQELTNRGYKVYVVAETATENILGGIKPSEVSLINFQKSIMEIQLNKEKVYREQAEIYSKEKNKNCVILYDRGTDVKRISGGTARKREETWRKKVCLSRLPTGCIT